MTNSHIDQAAGLRRIMAGPQPRVVSILSAHSVNELEKPRMMTNLALSLQDQNLDVLLVNAATDSHEGVYHYGLNGLPTLMTVAQQKHMQVQAILQTEQGLSVANLMSNKYLHQGLERRINTKLNALFEMLAHQFDVVLVDAELNDADVLPLPVLNSAEILIQMNQHPETIKQAYRLIKKLHSQLGPRSFGILITDADGELADKVFRNIAQVSRRYLGVALEFMGAIPADEHLKRAVQLNRPVIDAFPKATASLAFRSLAKRLNYQISAGLQLDTGMSSGERLSALAI